MPDPRHVLGHVAEEAVARWLTGAGWRILERRCRSPTGGEVDIVAIDPRRFLVAVEVRARRTHRTGRPVETVDPHRVARLERTLVDVAVTGRPAHAGLRVDLVTAEPLDRADGRWRLRRVPGIGDR